MKPVLIALLLALGAEPESKPALAGHYRLVGEQDAASSLVLGPDGHFRYVLAVGALDERAEGRWRAAEGRVVLETEPKPVPPVLRQAPASRTDAGPLSVRVSWPGGRGIAGVDVRIGFDRGEPVDGYTQEDGWRLPGRERRVPRWIELGVPMHGLASGRVPIDLAAGNALAFDLTPNDLGVVDFSGVTIEVAGEALIVHRGAGRLRYEPVRD